MLNMNVVYKTVNCYYAEQKASEGSVKKGICVGQDHQL